MHIDNASEGGLVKRSCQVKALPSVYHSSMPGWVWATLLIACTWSLRPSVAAQQTSHYSGTACHPDCTKRGNCNIEEGRCECPFGFDGPSCGNALLSSCQASATDIPFPWIFFPKNCECYRQAHSFFSCKAGCTPSLYHIAEIRCYEFAGKPPEEQWSAFPEVASDPGVVWRKGAFKEDGVALEVVRWEEGAVTRDLWGRTETALPPSKCPASCSGRGSCVRDQRGAEAVHCVCQKGFAGQTCETATDVLCTNRCSGRGACSQGFCHCSPPWFGAGCTRSLAFPPRENAATSRLKLRIYMYELPANIAFPIALDDNLEDFTGAYLAYMALKDQLVTDDVVRTEDPSEANLFYVPAQVYAYSSNVGSMIPHVQNVIRYINTTYPYWNKHQGRDHVMFISTDKGGCYAPAESRNMIKLTHFGFHARASDDPHGVKPLPLDSAEGCFNPERDVLMPPLHTNGAEAAVRVYADIVAAQGVDPGRTTLLLFSGSIREKDPHYSGGSRQALLHLLTALRGDPSVSDVIYQEGSVEHYETKLRSSKFCFAPYGSGYGMRLSTAMMHGCIPVVIQDHVVQPFEGEIHYDKFSLRLGHADIPNILPILRAISDAECAHLRLGMARHYTNFIWGPEGTAYNLTMRALRRRASNMWAELYRRK
ncbi:MAG: hypothetical protein WDW36_001219 [Sanguina aurantia]